MTIPTPPPPSQPPGQPPKKEAPPPVAPAFGEALELSLKALILPGSVFAGLAARPAPGAVASLGLGLAWGAAFFALNLAHAAISTPGALAAHAPAKVAVVGVLGLGLWTAGLLLSASLAYALGRALGTKGDFDRAAQLAGVALVAAPVQGLCNWFPVVWALPALLLSWIAAAGLTGLFGASAASARAACLTLGLLLVGAQYGARLVVEQAAQAAMSARLAASMLEAGKADGALQADLDALRTKMEQMQAQAAGRPGASSLDLLRGPGGEELAVESPAEQAQQAVAHAQSLEQNAAGMLDSVMPMLSNPAVTKNMNPAQKASLAELQKLMGEVQADMKAGRRVSDREQQARMAKIQGLTMSLMAAGMALPPAATAPAPAPSRENKR